MRIKFPITARHYRLIFGDKSELRDVGILIILEYLRTHGLIEVFVLIVQKYSRRFAGQLLKNRGEELSPRIVSGMVLVFR